MWASVVAFYNFPEVSASGPVTAPGRVLPQVRFLIHLAGSESIGFSSGFGGFGNEKVELQFFQWFWDFPMARRVIRLSWGGSAARPRGQFRDPFYHEQHPPARDY